MASSYSALF
jgi:hypothetical protein